MVSGLIPVKVSTLKDSNIIMYMIGLISLKDIDLSEEVFFDEISWNFRCWF